MGVNASHSALVEAPESGPARLDYFVRKRISQMRISGYEVARRGGPNRTTLYKAINGTGRLRESTLARIDLSLGWAAGSSASILAGGVPLTRMASRPEDEHALTVLRAASTLLDEATELISTVKGLVHELVDGSADGSGRVTEGKGQ
ncbi:hypothetical protein MAHJHV34_43760 [Mycobacterium avium subsp. hominissuis]